VLQHRRMSLPSGGGASFWPGGSFRHRRRAGRGPHSMGGPPLRVWPGLYSQLSCVALLGVVAGRCWRRILLAVPAAGGAEFKMFAAGVGPSSSDRCASG
jgi:hypothetical protein